jgi:PAS domain S-box-containing protein
MADSLNRLDQFHLDANELRRVLDAMPAMLAYWDKNQRCVFANRAYERWFGVSPDWLVGRTLQELLGPIYPLNLPYIEAALRGEAQEFEREIPSPDGSEIRNSLANYLPRIQNGVVLGFYVHVADVTELKRARQAAEDALAQVTRLQGLLPVCAWCRRIRNDQGYWRTLEEYLSGLSDVVLTHGICEECAHREFKTGPV